MEKDIIKAFSEESDPNLRKLYRAVGSQPWDLETCLGNLESFGATNISKNPIQQISRDGISGDLSSGTFKYNGKTYYWQQSREFADFRISDENINEVPDEMVDKNGKPIAKNQILKLDRDFFGPNGSKLTTDTAYKVLMVTPKRVEIYAIGWATGLLLDKEDISLFEVVSNSGSLELADRKLRKAQSEGTSKKILGSGPKVLSSPEEALTSGDLGSWTDEHPKGKVHKCPKCGAGFGQSALMQTVGSKIICPKCNVSMRHVVK